MAWPRWIGEKTLLWTDAKGRPIQITEVTIRTRMGQMLLTPTEKNHRLINGIFGRAMELYDTELYCVGMMTNHMGYMVGFRSAQHQAAFMRFVHGNIPKELGRHGDYKTTPRPNFKWHGGFWGARGCPIAAASEAWVLDRLIYHLGNGTKEGLARSPRGMGGAHSGRALCTLERLMFGTYFNRTKLRALRDKHGSQVPESEAATHYEIKLSKLPFLRHLSDEEYRDRCVALCDEIEAQAKAKFGPGFTPLGLRKQRRVDPRTVPDEMKCSPAPLIYCDTKEEREEYRAAYRDFVEAFQLAHQELRRCLAEGLPITVEFPPGGNTPAQYLRVRPPDQPEG